MPDRALNDAGASHAQARDDLGRDGCPAAAQADALEQPPVNQLVSAVDIPDAHRQQEPAQARPQKRVDLAVHRVGAMRAVPDNGIRAFPARLFQEHCQVVRPELAIGVSQEQPVVAESLQSGVDSCRYGMAVTAVQLVMHGEYAAGMFSLEPVGYLAGPIRAAVIDDNNAVRDAESFGGGKEVPHGGG